MNTKVSLAFLCLFSNVALASGSVAPFIGSYKTISGECKAFGDDVKVTVREILAGALEVRAMVENEIRISEYPIGSFEGEEVVLSREGNLVKTFVTTVDELRLDTRLSVYREGRLVGNKFGSLFRDQEDDLLTIKGDLSLDALGDTCMLKGEN